MNGNDGAFSGKCTKLQGLPQDVLRQCWVQSYAKLKHDLIVSNYDLYVVHMNIYTGVECVCVCVRACVCVCVCVCACVCVCV